MEDESSGGSGSDRRLDLTAKYYWTAVNNNPATDSCKLQITFEKDKFPSAAISRIRDYYLKGVLTHGRGLNFLHNILEPGGTDRLPYVFIRRGSTKVYTGDGKYRYKLRAQWLYMHMRNADKTQERQLHDFVVAERAAWRLIAGRELEYPATNEPVHMDNNGVLTAGLTGHHEFGHVKKSMSKIIMTPERKEAGAERWARFNEVNTITITYNPEQSEL